MGRSHGQHRRPRLGQHFLHDKSVIASIISSFAASNEDITVEIGPGHGALTAPLLQQLQCLHVVEKDIAMIDSLQQRHGTERLVIHHCDAVNFDYASLLSSATAKLRLIANLPYSISTPILFRLMELGDKIKDMTFMVQREVADRLLADPGNSDYGRLTVMVTRHYQVQRILNVAPGSFSPPPKVHSSVLKLMPLESPATGNDKVFADLVRSAFSARRKTLGNALAEYLDATSIAAAGIDPRLRPGDLSPLQYATLAKLVTTD